jgi:hypothetical protein
MIENSESLEDGFAWAGVTTGGYPPFKKRDANSIMGERDVATDTDPIPPHCWLLDNIFCRRRRVRAAIKHHGIAPADMNRRHVCHERA